MHLPPYDKFIELSDSEILLREVTNADLEPLMEITCYDGQPAHNLEAAAAMLDQIRTDYKNGNSIHWCIVEKSTNNITGTLGFYRGFTDGAGEIGCVLKPAFRGKGLMSSAVKLVVAFGFSTMKLKKIFAITTRQNDKAIKLLDRLNFVKIQDLEAGRIEYQIFM